MSPALPTCPQDRRRKSGVRILVATGSSGGHIFPALGFLDTLKQKYPDAQALLILPRKNSIDKVLLAKYETRYISISSVRLSLAPGNIISIIGLARGILESLLIILKFRPDIVVGFGSISSIPVVLLARLFGVKAMIHEQNVIPGRANRFLSGFADTIAVTFADTKDYLKKQAGKVVLTGNPLRGELKRIQKAEAAAFFGFSPDKFTVLVMGGSSGSRNINTAFIDAVSAMNNSVNLQIIHLSGERDRLLLEARYKSLSANARLFAFLNQMSYAYSAADLVISRAGSASLSEIMFFNLPAIIIPYPFAYAHQLGNAHALQRSGYVTIIKDDELKPVILRRVLEDFSGCPLKAGQNMRSGLQDITGLDANNRFLEAALSMRKPC